MHAHAGDVNAHHGQRHGKSPMRQVGWDSADRRVISPPQNDGWSNLSTINDGNEANGWNGVTAPPVQCVSRDSWADDIPQSTCIIYKDKMMDAIPIPANVWQHNTA